LFFLSLLFIAPSQPLLDFDPSSYAYFLGASIFVDPVLAANVSSQRVHFPREHDYVDWFDQRTVYKGGTAIDYPVDFFSFLFLFLLICSGAA
jgi:alpha-glucosidase (family GH31 glycosyl hydrolase)